MDASHAPEPERCFEHADGRLFTLQVVDCRVYLTWSGPDGAGASTSTRDGDEDARAHATAKVRSLLREGFVEGSPRPGRRFDRTADVVAVLRSDPSPGNPSKPRFDYRPVEGRTNVHRHHAVRSVDEWLVCNETRTSAIVTRTLLSGAAAPEGWRDPIAQRLLDELEARRDAIFACDAPLQKIALETRIGPFDRLVVLSPTTYDFTARFPWLGRSLWLAFPSFDCETIGSETVTEAEARTKGRGSIPYAQWDRAPHPVFDVRRIPRLDRPSREPFLIHDPRQLTIVSERALRTMKDEALEVRSFRGEVRRYERERPVGPEHLEQLAAFLRGT